MCVCVWVAVVWVVHRWGECRGLDPCLDGWCGVMSV